MQLLHHRFKVFPLLSHYFQLKIGYDYLDRIFGLIKAYLKLIYVILAMLTYLAKHISRRKNPE